MSNMKPRPFVKVFSLILSAAIIAVSIWAILNRQYVLDQLSVWTFQPSAAVQNISQRTALTQKGELTFYATRPAIDTRDAFNQACPRQETNSPILGCYTGDDRIFIYDITNQQLDGIEEVTAVHEMLHAQWKRTSAAEKATLTTQLEAAYNSIDDAKLKERMDYYKRTEPGEFVNELHSILGTEFPNLGSSLESYYSQFFSREKVLALHNAYNSVYTALYTQADELSSKMEALGTKINSESEAYTAATKQLSADINSFNTRANNGSFSSMKEFNTERASLVARSNALDQQREIINGDIDTYNSYYAQYKEVASQVDALNGSIDSFTQVQQAPSV